MNLRHFAAIATFLPAGIGAQSTAVPGFDAYRATYSQTSEMDIGRGGGEMDVSRFELRGLLSKPITVMDGLRILPLAEYKMTSLDFEGTSAAFPIQDEDLHSIGLSAFALRMCDDSPWIYGAWVRGEIASDFQHVDEDDFTFDVAAGAGYRVNDRFTIGAGAAVINLNGDAAFYPAINFDWKATDEVRVGLYGPTFVAAWSLHEDWLLSFRGDPGGGVWNITDDNGRSRSIDLSSYRLGLYASRRLTGQLWLTAGGGMAVGNEIDYTTRHGTEIFSREPDNGYFGMVSLRLKAW